MQKAHNISAIYCHPGGDVKHFTEQQENTLSKIENDKTIKHNIITGDFNTDLIKFDLNDNTNEYVNAILKNGFLPTTFYQLELRAILTL